MDIIWQVALAGLAMAGVTIVLSIALIIGYTTIVGIQSVMEERKNKRGKHEK